MIGLRRQLSRLKSIRNLLIRDDPNASLPPFLYLGMHRGTQHRIEEPPYKVKSLLSVSNEH